MVTASGQEVVAIIPARGGSKGLPSKNIRHLAGRPLIAHSIDVGRASRLVDRVIVSTDDDEIATVAVEHGAEVPFLRPSDLAEDDTPDLPVFRHALEWLADHEQWEPDVVVQLRPTSPLRRVDDVDRAIEELDRRPDIDSVRSVTEPFENPYKMWSVDDDGLLAPLVPSDLAEPFNMPRQRLPDTYWQTGAIDVMRRRTVLDDGSMTGNRIAPVFVEALGAVDIDTQASLDLVEWMIATGRVPWFDPGPASDRLAARRRPALLVLDCDGVLTDNHVVVSQTGEESVVFDRGDGMGIRLVRESGVPVVVLSTEENPVVGARCEKLGIPYRQGVADKVPALVELADEHGADLTDVAYVGNDVNDLGCLERVGLAVVVADAHADVLGAADVVLSNRGGHGAVREICDRILALEP